jgi:hypothetical protein
MKWAYNKTNTKYAHAVTTISAVVTNHRVKNLAAVAVPLPSRSLDLGEAAKLRASDPR